MYLRYFGFSSYPFAVTPDPAFLYLSHSHRDALGHLLYGAGEQGGFVALIGEVGTGKTTLIRAVVEDDTPDLDIALCWNPHLGVTEFVGTICDELGVAYDAERDTTLKALVDRLNVHLLEAHAANRRTILIIDEAQNLSREVLEQLRLLTNLETHKDKLLRVILVGQPELDEQLARHDLRQLAQRITARFRLQPLGLAETRAYVRHRLERAGGPQHLFSRSSVVMLRALTRGVPRLINMVCERSLMGAYAHGRAYVGPWTVMRAATETLPARPRRASPRWWRFALPTGLVISAIVIALAWLPDIPLTSAAEWIHDNTTHHDHATSTTKSDVKKAATRSHSASDDKAGARASAAADKHDDSGHDDSSDSGSDSTAEDNAAHAEKNAAKDSGHQGQSGDKSGVSAQSEDHDDNDGDDDTASEKDTHTLPGGDADLNQLLRLWGVFGARVRSGCSELHVGDLRCLDDTGDVDTIKHYNRPALLILKHDGHQQTVLLTAINDNDTVTLAGGDGTRDLDRQRLHKAWTGRFKMIWRSNIDVNLIQPGSVGDAVVWLRKRLLQIDGKDPEHQVGKPSPVYDHKLGERLKAFQKSHGLDPDGLAGPRTQMMLNGAVASPGAPSLMSAQSSSESK